ncbi:MAG: CRISPR-associated endoribonuclease Cas6 [Saprospiraceae bacterium]
MRIQLTLTCQRGTLIPINYQSEISDWIYQVLAKSGSKLQDWMAAHCYDASLRNFKAFTFSPLAIFPYELEQQTQQFRLLGNQIRVHVSFYLDRSFEYDLISGFRVQPLTLGKFGDKPARFEIKRWQVLDTPPLSETMMFRAISPVAVNLFDDARSNIAQSLVPDHDTYDFNMMYHNIIRMKAAKSYASLADLGYLTQSFPFEFKLLSRQNKSRLIHVKDAGASAQIRGFIYDFEITMPHGVMEFCYLAGFGQFSHLGFGYVDLLPADNQSNNNAGSRPPAPRNPS